MGNDPEAVKLLIAKSKAKQAELKRERNRLTDKKEQSALKAMTEEQRKRI